MTKIPGTNKHIRRGTIANNPKPREPKDPLRKMAEKIDRDLRKAAKKLNSI